MNCPKCKQEIPKSFPGKPWKFCVNCGEKLVNPLPEKIIITMHLHGNKEDSYAAGECAGLSDEACKNFMYALYEVKFSLMVNTKDGNFEIVRVDDRVLLPKEGHGLLK